MTEKQFQSHINKLREKLGQGPSFVPLRDAGMLTITGETHLEYLQRQSSNNLDLLSKQQSLANTLPNPSGNVLEPFITVKIEGGVGLLTEGPAGSLAEYFKKRIFFNDQVEVSDVSEKWQQFLLIGNEMPKEIIGIKEREEFRTEASLFGGRPGKIIRLKRLKGFDLENFLLLINVNPGDKAVQSTIEALGLRRLNSNQYRMLRILEGLAWGEALRGKFTPFEMGLEHAVSGEKGCYTGQEVLARQVTYGKVNKGRILITGKMVVENNGQLLNNGQVIGEIVDSVTDEDGKTLVLAIARVKGLENGQRVEIKAIRGEKEAQIIKIFV